MVELIVVLGVDVAAQRDAGHFDVECRCDENVTSGEVAVYQALREQVLHAKRCLVAHRKLLTEGQVQATGGPGRCNRSRILSAVRSTRISEERFEVALKKKR